MSLAKEMEVDSTIEKFLRAATTLNLRYDALNTMYSTADQTISDILHSVEFGSNSAVEATQLYKLLKSVLQQRRVVKEQIGHMNVLYNKLKIRSDDVAEVTSRINSRVETGVRYRTHQNT